MQHFLSRLLFGQTEFPESEEYLEFRYKFLCVLMVASIAFALFFLALLGLGLVVVDRLYTLELGIFVIITTILWRLLVWEKQWLRALSWAFEILVLALITLGTIHVPNDELRIVWFYVNVSAVYVLAGQRIGFGITLLTGIIFLVGNAYLTAPYSAHAVMTAEIFLAYLSVFFHAHASRSLSYFTRMREYNQRLQQQATHDPLTNVLNARAYYQICEKLLEYARLTGASQSVLFIDLDHFKSINDHHSHQTGDEVLQAVARCMRHHLRKTDVLGRIGGEEFSVFLPGTGLDGALAVAETLRKAVENLKPPLTTPNADQSLQITASIGVATTQGDWNESMTLIQRRADAAMYQAKKKGRNRVDVVQG
jgi:diguanylate cyclase (GGDEF)-like protein